jgi:hypothetical protein
MRPWPHELTGGETCPHQRCGDGTRARATIIPAVSTDLLAAISNEPAKPPAIVSPNVLGVYVVQYVASASAVEVATAVL